MRGTNDDEYSSDDNNINEAIEMEPSKGHLAKSLMSSMELVKLKIKKVIPLNRFKVNDL